MQKTFASVSLVAFCFIFAGCASEKKSDPLKMIALGGGVSGGAQISGVAGAPGSGKCENVAELDSAGLKRIKDFTELRKGKWRLVAVDHYSHEVGTQGAYVVRSEAASGFRADVTCNSLEQLSGEKEVTRKTLPDGTVETTSTLRTSNNNSEFQAAEWLDTARVAASDTQRKVGARFKNGKLEEAKSEVVVSQDGNFDLKFPSVEEMNVGGRNTATVRLYLSQNGQLEIRTKMRAVGDEADSVTELFARFAFEFEN